MSEASQMVESQPPNAFVAHPHSDDGTSISSEAAAKPSSTRFLIAALLLAIIIALLIALLGYGWDNLRVVAASQVYGLMISTPAAAWPRPLKVGSASTQRALEHLRSVSPAARRGLIDPNHPTIRRVGDDQVTYLWSSVMSTPIGDIQARRVWVTLDGEGRLTGASVRR